MLQGPAAADRPGALHCQVGGGRLHQVMAQQAQHGQQHSQQRQQAAQQEGSNLEAGLGQERWRFGALGGAAAWPADDRRAD